MLRRIALIGCPGYTACHREAEIRGSRQLPIGTKHKCCTCARCKGMGSKCGAGSIGGGKKTDYQLLVAVELVARQTKTSDHVSLLKYLVGRWALSRFASTKYLIPVLLLIYLVVPTTSKRSSAKACDTNRLTRQKIGHGTSVIVKTTLSSCVRFRVPVLRLLWITWACVPLETICTSEDVPFAKSSKLTKAFLFAARKPWLRGSPFLPPIVIR